MAQIGKCRLIVNPVSANGATAKKWPRIRALLERQGLRFDYCFTERIGHAVELARRAVEDGCQLVVAVGGDGTVNEVANGLVGNKGEIPTGVVLGMVPVGTGADFGRTFGIPRDYEQACQCLMGETTRTIDLGVIDYSNVASPVRRYYVNVAGSGFDGEVAERVNRSSKVLGGTIPYLSCLVVTLIAYKNKMVEITYDGRKSTRRANSVIVCNGRYFGGGMFIAPNADPSDGFFDVVVIGDTGRLEFLQAVPRVYKGTHLTHPKVESFRAREIRMETRERMLIQADGELLGQAPATFSLIPQGLVVKV